MIGKIRHTRFSARSSLIVGLVLGFLSIQNPSGGAGQSESIISSIKAKRIQLIAVTVGGENQTIKREYKVGESPMIQLSLVNQSRQNLPLQTHNRFTQFRLDLKRDGMVVDLRPEMTKRLDREAAGDEGFKSVTNSDPVKPFRTAVIDVLRLDDWYDQLAAGRYFLTVRYRIANSKEMEIVTHTEFSVVP